MSAQGELGREPTFVAPGVGDSGTGLHAGIGMLAALRRRDATGEPQRVEVSMQDGIVNLMRIRMIDTFNSGLPVQRSGNRIWGEPSMLYPCKPGGPDDYVAIVMAGDSWDSILALADRADLIGDPRYATAEARQSRLDEVEEIIASWTRTVTKFEAMETLTDLGIPASAVQDSCEVPDPHLKARERPRPRARRLPNHRVQTTTSRSVHRRCGEHSEEVLSEMLGMSHEEIR